MSILKRIRWDMIIVWVLVPGILWYFIFLFVKLIAKKMGWH